MMGIWVVVAVAFVVGMYVLGRVVGAFQGWLWARLHGQDRTLRASRILVGCVLAAQLLSFGLVALADVPEVLVLLPFLAVYLAGLYGTLRSHRPPPVVAAVEPPGVTRTHDGITFEVTSRAAGVSAVLLVLAMASPVPMAILAFAWAKSGGSRVRVRLLHDAIEVQRGARRERASLRGATVEEATAWDGTPCVRVANDGGAADVGVGSVAPEVVAWVRETLRDAVAAADRGEATELPPTPEALRRMTSRTVSER